MKVGRTFLSAHVAILLRERRSSRKCARTLHRSLSLSKGRGRAAESESDKYTLNFRSVHDKKDSPTTGVQGVGDPSYGRSPARGGEG